MNQSFGNEFLHVLGQQQQKNKKCIVDLVGSKRCELINLMECAQMNQNSNYLFKYFYCIKSN